MTDIIEITLDLDDFIFLQQEADRRGMKSLDELINSILSDYCEGIGQ